MTTFALIFMFVGIIWIHKVMDPKRVKEQVRGRVRPMARYEDYFIDDTGTINYHKHINIKG
jgi:hypothetical protein